MDIRSPPPIKKRNSVNAFSGFGDRTVQNLDEPPALPATRTFAELGPNVETVPSRRQRPYPHISSQSTASVAAFKGMGDRVVAQLDEHVPIPIPEDPAPPSTFFPEGQEYDPMPTPKVPPRPNFFKSQESVTGGGDQERAQEGTGCLAWLRYLRAVSDGTAPNYNAYFKRANICVSILLNAVPRGVGQVTFVNNPFTGGIILLALFCAHPEMAAVGLLGIIISNLTAVVMGFDRAQMDAGLFGYNGVLCSMGMVAFLSWPPTSAATWILLLCFVVLVSSLSTIVTVALANAFIPTFHIAPLTFPFSIVSLLAIAAARSSPRFPVTLGIQPADIPVSFDVSVSTSSGRTVNASEWEFGDVLNPNQLSFEDFLLAALRGVSQVYISDNAVVGGVILLAMACSSRISAYSSLLGSVSGIATAVMLGMEDSAIKSGLFGYAGALGCVAVNGVFYVPTWRATILGVLCAITSTFIHVSLVTFLTPYGVPPMSFGFTIGTTFFTLLQRSASSLVPIALDRITTPEGHMRRYKRALLRQALAQQNPQNGYVGQKGDVAQQKQTLHLPWKAVAKKREPHDQLKRRDSKRTPPVVLYPQM